MMAERLVYPVHSMVCGSKYNEYGFQLVLTKLIECRIL